MPTIRPGAPGQGKAKDKQGYRDPGCTHVGILAQRPFRAGQRTGQELAGSGQGPGSNVGSYPDSSPKASRTAASVGG